MNELEGEAINQKANEKAMSNFKTLQKNSIMQNKQLQNDLEAHKEELGTRQTEHERLIEENNKFKQNFQLNQDGIKKYQGINYQQAKKIRKLKEKIEYLKKYISKEVAKYLKEIEYLKYQKQTQETETEYQLNSKCAFGFLLSFQL